MSSTMWYIMQSIQSKYSLSERLIRTIAFIRSFPHDNVEDLIRRGADVNRMHGTLKPLHCACMVADADCVELLLEKGAEVNAVDGYNRTALHYAAEKDEGCVELLLEYGALPDALDGNKDTPLHWAAFKDNPECARALLEGGARPDARDYNRDTPLSWAAMKGNLESVRVLLDFGAQAHVTNLKGQTPVSRLAALLARGLGAEREEECLRLLCRAAGSPTPPELSRDPQLLARLGAAATRPPHAALAGPLLRPEGPGRPLPARGRQGAAAPRVRAGHMTSHSDAGKNRIKVGGHQEGNSGNAEQTSLSPQGPSAPCCPGTLRPVPL
ncbi:hypothetical protein SKAU_G00100710 [Synaphobranchus kaupii]|uniref:Ankyrin repeat and SOCS box protein 8 n=1 Tax=Synaphobranchus kaupii TaxID=118154 RepID=A0A9Q1FYC0_SYNKA|nr:hypothetical protein SKAU_G00100710 [Synaphobranchus kaupii]